MTVPGAGAFVSCGSTRRDLNTVTHTTFLKHTTPYLTLGDGNKPWADGGEGSEVKQWTTGEIDRQTEITGAMKLTSSDEKAKYVHVGVLRPPQP